MTAIYAVTFVMSAVLICKWTLSYYDDDDENTMTNQKCVSGVCVIDNSNSTIYRFTNKTKRITKP